MAQFAVNGSPKSGRGIRKARVFALVMAILLTLGLNAYNQVQVFQTELKQDVQGLSEYELCMYTYDKFDIEMLKQMGCVNEKYKALSSVK